MEKTSGFAEGLSWAWQAACIWDRIVSVFPLQHPGVQLGAVPWAGVLLSKSEAGSGAEFRTQPPKPGLFTGALVPAGLASGCRAVGRPLSVQDGGKIKSFLGRFLFESHLLSVPVPQNTALENGRAMLPGALGASVLRAGLANAVARGILIEQRKKT